MTSQQIRQSFLDFFQSKGHTIVLSSSLLPDAPNLLFTNAGMNQFVPIFLGQRAPDVDKWPGAIPGLPTRAADTQKCIRAGGKHNDLEDVGLDTYHHTLFEMLGNWSFGDYFKKEAIEWAWELIVEGWKFPKDRLYATVYKPGPGEPAEFDQEAYDHWARVFTAAGLDPKVHIVYGGKKDNFWMMGDTGPCGPCSEIHMDLTPEGDTRGALVNKGDPRCIEIWNLVFIQFNANADGTFSPLPAKHVDTGMGFERVTSFIQCTKGFTDFANAKISNYETDIFRPIFDAIEKLSGKKYCSTLPASSSAMGSATVPVASVGVPPTESVQGAAASPPAQAASHAPEAVARDARQGDRDGRAPHPPEQIQIDVAFRVIADHIRTLGFAIADGIKPSNEGRGYVLRRILRRAVRYGRTLGFHEPFFYKLVDVLADTMGDVFPEIRARKQQVQETIRIEEEAFNKTLDAGLKMFDQLSRHLRTIPAEQAFKLYDTYGFPIDLTELMAREAGGSVDTAGFEKLMEEQRARARAAQKKEVISLSELETKEPTAFEGFNSRYARGKVLEVVSVKDKTAVVLDRTSFYAEMGGQVGDTGELRSPTQSWPVINTQKNGDVWLHFLAGTDAPPVGSGVEASVDSARRVAIERHHTVTHILHWALHEVVSREATQKGSFVGPDKLTFDFNAQPLTPQQVADIEKLVNERILENALVDAKEFPYAEIKARKDVMQFFGDKYGAVVRVVQIGGTRNHSALNGYSMELCGGTHTRATGEIGLFRIVGENAIAAGVRRIEAVGGLEAYRKATDELSLIKMLAGKVNSPVHELEKKIESLLAHQKELEKQLKSAQQKQAVENARALLGKTQTVNGIPAIIERMDADGDTLQAMANELKGKFKGVIVLGGAASGAVALVASVSPEFTAKVQAGKIIQTIAPVVGGKGGGKPDNARGGGKDVSQVDEALAKAKSMLG